MVKQLSREMKNSGIEWIGDIPEDWEIRKYKHFAISGMGKTILKEDLDEIGFPVYSATQDDTIFGYLNKVDLVLNKGDIVIPARGNSIGCVYLVKEDIATCTQTTIYSKIRNISNEYLSYCAQGLKEHWFEFDNTAIPQITVSQVQNNLVPVPPINQQQRIANFLDQKVAEIDHILKKTRESIEEYKKYKQSIITEAVTKGLNPNIEMKDSGIDWIGEIPKHWEIRNLRYLGTLQNGISKSGDDFGFGYPFVSYGDVYKNYSLPLKVGGLVNSTEKDRDTYSARKGDVFFTRTSETIEEVGFAATCLENIENAVFAGFVIRFRPNTDDLVENFSKYYFRSDMHRRFFVKEMNLVTRASLSQELLKKLPVVIPSKKEQQQISKFLDKQINEIDSLISQKETLLKDLEVYKKSLIYECVTGKREVGYER